jgi:hypothetical protein
MVNWKQAIYEGEASMAHVFILLKLIEQSYLVSCLGPNT